MIMNVYQIVLIDGDGASFTETPLNMVYKSKGEANAVKERYLKSGDWWDVEVRTLVVV